MIEKGFKSYKVPENRSQNKPDIEFSKSVQKGRREIWKNFSQCKMQKKKWLWRARNSKTFSVEMPMKDPYEKTESLGFLRLKAPSQNTSFLMHCSFIFGFFLNCNLVLYALSMPLFRDRPSIFRHMKREF